MGIKITVAGGSRQQFVDVKTTPFLCKIYVPPSPNFLSQGLKCGTDCDFGANPEAIENRWPGKF
jgi:hypothetical protein